MTTSYLKATPNAIMRGIQDLSRRSPVIQPELLPQHLPHIYTLAERGRTTAHIASGDALLQLYGDKVLDLTSPFATHQTALAQKFVKNANFCMWERLKPAGAKTALLRYSLEVIPAEVTLYARNADGSYQYNNAGALVPQQVDDGSGNMVNVTIKGHRLVWHKGVAGYTLAAQKAFGKGQPVASFRPGTTVAGTDTLSTLVNSTTTTAVVSKLYPIMDVEVDSFGNYGNRVGLGINPANADDLEAGDVSAMNVLGSFLYRFTAYERPVNSATPVVQTTVDGANSIDLGFKPDIFHPIFADRVLNFGESFIEQYQSLDDPTLPPQYGPFGRSHVYQANLEAVLSLLINGGTDQTIPTVGEKQYDATALAYGRTSAIAFTGKPENLHLLNLFNGVDQNGVPYFTFDVNNSVVFGGIAFGDGMVHYAEGGDDGLPLDASGKIDRLQTLRVYDELVAAQLTAYGAAGQENHYLDVARYPHSTFWDTGFSLETKKKLLIPMARRKDIWVILSTQSIAEYADPLNPTPQTWAYADANDVSDDSSMALLLSTTALMYPESEIYGTPACRVAVVGHCGKPINSTYRGDFLPLTLELGDAVSKFMGAGTGNWISQYAIDENPNNVVRGMRVNTINHIWKPQATYNKDWDNGLVWVQSFDRRSVFFPALQTVYPDDTSVLNSLVTVAACCFIEKIHQTVWRYLTGGSKLTDDQFIERSNRLINEQLKDRFDRFVLVSETTRSPIQLELGYPWTAKVHIYANDMRTVGDMSVVAHRMSDLNAA